MGRKERGAHAAGKKDRPVSVSAMLASMDASATKAAKPFNFKPKPSKAQGVVLPVKSIDALADALDEFAGAVVLVSHDSRLISRVCDDETRSQIWVVEDGAVNTFDGTFEDYKDELMEEIKKEVAD
ncbi:hypothetical protein C2845_PM07G14480 [Panicum miliaceum]|uniref:ABC transporter F family member 4-like n=1 Tax=Panicum miliaceum TaxID=4540 RepID=A0A3L6SL68_PANMI|nr:hypothetical protein C2845_PM07G14480 [Panicum miliaceum]